MALKDIQIPKVEVKVGPGSSFAVRGLSTSDIEHLVRTHGQSLRDLFDEFVNGGSAAMDFASVAPLLKKLLGRCPDICADIIRIGADADAEDAAMIPKLTAAIQVSALLSIATLTLNVEGDMGKALETVIGMLGNVNGTVGELLKGIAKT